MAARKTESKSTKSGQVVVTAPLVQVTTDDGKVLHLHQGDLVPSSVSDASVEHLKSIGFVTEGDAPVGEPDASDNN